MSIKTNKVRLSTDITINYAETGNPEGRKILFIHGFPDSWKSFKPVMELLDPKYHAFSIDLRGFGDSSRPEVGYTRDDFAKDAADFLDALKIEKASIVGHSMGSLIAQAFVVSYPGKTEKLVLIGSAARTKDNAAILEILPVIEALKDPIDRDFITEFQNSTYYGKIPQEFFDSVINESLKAPAFVWKQAIKTLSEEDRQAELNRITQPTLIAWGDYDGIFPMAEQYKLVKAIPNSRLKIYKGAGHSLNWDHVEEFTKDLEEFLR